MAKNGRPSGYTQEIAETICERIAEGVPLVKICKGKGMPAYRTVLRWRTEKEGFSHLYAQARGDAADTLADKIQDLAERVELGTLDYNAGRVAIDALKWIASKLKPKSYGDRQAIEHQGEVKMRPIDMAPEWLREDDEDDAASAVQEDEETAAAANGHARGDSEGGAE